LFCKGLSDTNPVIRSKIASLLGEISDPRAIPALVTSLSDPEEKVRDEAKPALISIGSPCYDKVLPLLTHESLQVVTDAIIILPEVNRKKGIAAVIPFFRDPRDEVWDAVYRFPAYQSVHIFFFRCLKVLIEFFGIEQVRIDKEPPDSCQYRGKHKQVRIGWEQNTGQGEESCKDKHP
jgi:hypothetical protein